MRTKPFKNLGEYGTWANPGTPQIFEVPPIISGTGKATNFKLGRYIHRVHANKSPQKFGRKWSMGVFRDCPKFLSTAYYLRNGSCYELQTWQVYSQGPCEQKPFKNLGEYGTWANPGTPQFFEVPPIISGMGKATHVKFGRCIQMVHANKNRLKIWEKMERGRIQGLPQFFEYPLLSQERVKLRTSNLAGIFTGSMRTKAL